MYKARFASENRKCSLNITIKSKTPKRFRVFAKDDGKPNSFYADRAVLVDNGSKDIYLSFPCSPKSLAIGIVNISDVMDKDFEVDIKEGDLKTYNIWIDAETNKFLKLATAFSQRCGYEDASDTGRIFQTDDSEFVIKYFNVITDPRNGNAMNTPARIGHNTGIIETAKIRMDKYTVPMRMIILLHEFSHKYKNPKIGLKIEDEVGADINALYIYLGLGYSKIDAICVFAKVFLKAQSQSNMNRMRKIMDYIQKFENEEFAQLN